jgi:hypothetical protein
MPVFCVLVFIPSPAGVLPPPKILPMPEAIAPNGLILLKNPPILSPRPEAEAVSIGVVLVVKFVDQVSAIIRFSHF